MDDIASRIVNDAVLEEKSSTPDTECTDTIGERQPQWDKNHPRREVHAAEVGPSGQDESNGGKDELEVYH